jgi:hypothetical protein
MFILDPDFYPSWISDPTTATKEKEVKNLLSYLSGIHKYHKIENIIFFEQVKKKN